MDQYIGYLDADEVVYRIIKTPAVVNTARYPR